MLLGFRMKVCDVTQFYSAVGGGVKRYLHEKRRHVQALTGDEHVLLIPGERTECLRDGRLTIYTIASPRLDKTSRYRLLLNLKEAERIIRKERPDVIESGDPYHLGWRMADLARDLEIPIVGFYHSHFPEAYLRTILKYCGPWLRDAVMAYAQDYIRRFYNQHDATLVPSPFLAGLLESWGVLNTEPVHLGVDTDIFSPAPPGTLTRAQLGFSGDRTLLLYIGRFAGEKNTPTLMEAFRLLDRRHPGRFAFAVVGDGAMRPLVQEAGAGLEAFYWMSYCDNARTLADYYRLADLFVHPGVCETFGLVTMESQACGCPVIGIRGSYMDNNIFAGLEGWAGANTPEALASAIARHSGDRAELKRLGIQASGEVRRRYGWDRVFARIWEVYHQVIDRRMEERRYGALMH
jgi:alpha-1,6-mannosyltransferase